MRAQLQTLAEELRRLKASGARTVCVADDTLEQLRAAVRESLAESPVAPDVSTPSAPRANMAPAPKVDVASSPAPARVAPTPAPSNIPPPPAVALPAGDKRTRWTALVQQVATDPVCCAHIGPGKKVVVGVGDLDAKIFFCGEAPGAEEEVQGEPFVGPAGQLLTRMIQAMGLKREQVYIGNIMNWRPEMPAANGGVQAGNRPPTAQEIAYCLPYLQAQLDIVQPDLIVALGATAAGGLLGAGSFKTLGEIKGRWHEFAGKPVMVTYHPSYILRNASNRSKRGIWEDLMKVMERAGLPLSEKQRNFFL